KVLQSERLVLDGEPVLRVDLADTEIARHTFTMFVVHTKTNEGLYPEMDALQKIALAKRTGLSPLIVGDFNTPFCGTPGAECTPEMQAASVPSAGEAIDYLRNRYTVLDDKLSCPAQAGLQPGVKLRLENNIVHALSGRPIPPVDFSCNAGELEVTRVSYQKNSC